MNTQIPEDCPNCNVAGIVCEQCVKSTLPAMENKDLPEDAGIHFIPEEESFLEARHEAAKLAQPPARKPHIFILCHRDCDGWAAGAIAYTSLSDSEHEIKVFGCQYGEELPEMDLQPEDQVFFLDFSASREKLLDIAGRVSKLEVLDHHQSAKDELEGLPFVTFDMTKSGVLLAWERFVPEYPAPASVVMLDCYDLWKKEHPDFTWEQIVSFQMACAAQQGNLSFWSALMNGYYIDPKLTDLGNELYARFKTSVRQVKEAPTTEIVEVDGQRGVVFFCQEEISLMSDALYNDPELNVTWSACLFQRKDNWICSFRSKTRDFAVLPFAKKLGGGGHLTAASGRLAPVETLDTTDVVKELLSRLTA